MFISDPDFFQSQIPDLSQVPDPGCGDTGPKIPDLTKTENEGEKISCLTFFVAIMFTKIEQDHTKKFEPIESKMQVFF